MQNQLGETKSQAQARPVKFKELFGVVPQLPYWSRDSNTRPVIEKYLHQKPLEKAELDILITYIRSFVIYTSMLAFQDNEFFEDIMQALNEATEARHITIIIGRLENYCIDPL